MENLGISHYPFWARDMEEVTANDIHWLDPVTRWDPRHNREVVGRPTQGFGEAEFSYAGKTINPRPWNDNPKIDALRRKLERFLGVEFYFCLVGLYEDHTIGIPMHHDEIDHDDDIIASISFGATRVFEMQPVVSTLPLQRFILESGDLVIMTGENQRLAQHAVPPVSTPCGPRVNLTFRTKRSF